MLANKMRMAAGAGTDLGPGPQTLLYGDMTAGYFGVVTADEANFITMAELLSANYINFTNGTANTSNRDWLKFAWNNTILYVAQKTIRYNVSWDQIAARGAIVGNADSANLSIKGYNFKCRVLTGGATDNTASREASEWENLIYGVHTSESPNWGSFNDETLLTHYIRGNGSYSWCQETATANSSQRVVRGYSGVAGWDRVSASSVGPIYGFRPCLELL
jgi:hypothetical protein